MYELAREVEKYHLRLWLACRLGNMSPKVMGANKQHCVQIATALPCGPPFGQHIMCARAEVQMHRASASPLSDNTTRDKSIRAWPRAASAASTGRTRRLSPNNTCMRLPEAMTGSIGCHATSAASVPVLPGEDAWPIANNEWARRGGKRITSSA